MMSSDANNNKKMNLPPLRFNSVTKHESFLSNKQLPRILTSPKSLGIKQSLSPRRLAKPDPTVDQEGAHANDQDADKKRPLSMYTCVSPTPWSILRSRSTEASKSSLMRPKSQPSINLLDNDDSLVLSPVRSKSSWRKELSQKIKYIDANENSSKTPLLPEKENGSRSEHSQVQSSEEKTEDSINLPSNDNKREITKHVNSHSLQDLSSNLDGVPSNRPDSQVINSYNEQKINEFSDNIINKQSTNLSSSNYTSKTTIALGNKQFFKKLDSPCSKAIEDAKSVPLSNDDESKDDNSAKDLLNFSEIPQPIYDNNVNVNTDPNGHDFRSNSPLAVVLPGCSGRCVLIPEDDEKEVVPLPPKSSASKPSRGRAKKPAAVVSTITPVREEHGDHECFIEDKKAKDKLQDCPKSVEVSDNPDFANVIQTSLDEKASSETTGYHKNVPLENEICISGLLPGDNQHDTKKCSTHMHNDNNDGETCLSYNTSKCEQTDLNVPDSSQASNLLPVKGSEVNLPEKISFTSINNLTTSNVIENECTDTIINEMSKKDSRTKHPKGHKMTPLLAVLDQPMPSPRRRPRVSRRMSDKPIHLDDDEFVGFATLPDQVHRKAVKRGFDFNLMVVGETGLGKSTLINSLFLTDLYNDRTLPNVADSVKQTVNIEKKTLEIEERGVKLRLTIVDTPGFNDNLNCEESWKTIPNYINDQFEQYYQAESGLNRKNIQDTRIHCLLYFISPYGHGLRPVDIMVMKHLHNKVNIVPLVAKADILTPKEVKKLKERILQEIEDNHINIYQFPDCDSDEDESFKEQDKALKAAVPFAVVGSNTILEVGGKKVRGRMYPWGIVEVDNPKHCDFTKLRQMLISTHMQDLKDITADVHYENFRAEHLAAEMKNTQKERNKLKRDSVTGLDKVADTDLLLQQKEAEIQRMQAMLAKMQAQLQNGGS